MDRANMFLIGFIIGGLAMLAFIVFIVIDAPEADASLAIGLCPAIGYDEANEINDVWYCVRGGENADVVAVDTLVEYLSKHKETHDE